MLSSDDRLHIALLAPLIPDDIKPGSVFLVEFDAESQWLAVATTITAAYLREGGRACYMTSVRPPDSVRENLGALGLDVLRLIAENRLLIDDWYTATLTGGRIDAAPEKFSVTEPIEGGSRLRSLKVADLSVKWLKDMKEGFKPEDIIETWPPGALGVWESMSEMLRFNEEGPLLEWMISRAAPNERRAKRINLSGVVRDLHSVALYKRLESALDAVIELRVVEQGDEAKNMLRIRSLKGQPHDARWHEIEIKTNGEATLVS